MDLGAEFWAAMILLALVVIEVLQLGPHRFSGSAKEKTKNQKLKPGLTAAASQKVGGAARKRRNHHTPLPPSIDKNIFRDSVLRQTYMQVGEEDALLYVGKGGEDLELRPTGLESSAEGEFYPQTSELDNFILACGQESVVKVVRQLETLWAARDRTDVKYVVLYSVTLPSTYAVQCIADTLGAYVDKAGVSVLYLEDTLEGNVEEKREHLNKAGISLEQIT